MFCSHCGKPLVPDAVFCSYCGGRLEILPAPPEKMSDTYAPPTSSVNTGGVPPTPSVDTGGVPDAEDVLLVLKATRRLTATSAAVCHIVFKRNLLVLAYMTERLQQLESARLARALSAQTLSATKRGVVQTRFWSSFYKRYYTMTTEDILAEEPFNGAIQYRAIALIDYSHGYSVSDDNSSYDYDGILHLTLRNGEVLRFKHKERQNDAIEEALTELFGPKLRHKRQIRTSGL